MFSFNGTSDFVKDYKALNLNLAKVTFLQASFFIILVTRIIPFKHPPHILCTLSIILVTDDASLTF